MRLRFLLVILGLIPVTGFGLISVFFKDWIPYIFMYVYLYVRVTLTLIAIVAVLLFAPLFTFFMDKHMVPEGLHAEIVTYDISSGVREGSSVILYKLPDQTVKEIEEKGLSYFDFETIGRPPKEHPENLYQEWKQTPIPGEIDGNPCSSIYACGAMSGSSSKKEIDAIDFYALLKSPGNYYVLSKNREGMILVVPAQRIALYLYFG